MNNLNKYFVVRPCNVYGPGDNFDPENAMVIPTLINRIFNKENPVKIWGDGSATREFLYVKDAAEAIRLSIDIDYDSDYVNLGTGTGYSVKQVLEAFEKWGPEFVNRLNGMFDIAIYKLNENKPQFPEDGDFWVAPDANVIGKVRLGAGASGTRVFARPESTGIGTRRKAGWGSAC